MKLKSNYYLMFCNKFLYLILGVFLFYSCQDDLLIGLSSKEKELQTSQKTVIEQAQEYTERVGDIFCSIYEKKQLGQSRGSQVLNPDWKHAVVKELRDRYTVEVPLISCLIEKAKIKYLHDNLSEESLRDVSYKLFIHKSKKTGKFYQYISSRIQLNDTCQQNPLYDNCLIVDYNMNYQIYSVRESQGEKFRLLQNVKEKDSDSTCYVINIAGEPQQFSSRAAYFEELKCPICDAVLRSNNYCMYHGYVLDEVDIVEHPNYTRIISSVIYNCCQLMGEAYYYHWNSSSCNGACCDYCDKLRNYLADRFASCIDGIYDIYYVLIGDIGDNTAGFMNASFANPYYFQMAYPDVSTWKNLNSFIVDYESSLVWNLSMALAEYDLMWDIPTEPDPGDDSGSETGGGGGTDGDGNVTDPKLDEDEPRAVLSVHFLTYELMEKYTMKVEVPACANLGPIIPVINNAEFLIRRKGTENWLSLGNEYNGNPLYHDRIAITPGFFELKAEVHIVGGIMIESNIVEVEEQYPSIYSFQNNPEVLSRAVALWDKTVEFATQNKNTHQVREYGCFIYLNTEDGTYSTGIDIPGNPVTLDQEVTATVDFEYYNIMPDPRETGLLIVGTLHSHYPLTWAGCDMFRDVGPSDEDKNFDLPGIVYDYKYRVYTGDPVDMKNNPKDYYIYGSERRATPEI